MGDFRFEGTAAGHTTLVDGHEAAGPDPVSLLLEALGSCGAIDVVRFLVKEDVSQARAEVEVFAGRLSAS